MSSAPPAANWTFNATEQTAAMRARVGFTSYLHEHCTPDSDIVAAEIVFAELISNAFRHGGGGPVQIWVELDSPECILHVRDGGTGFDPGTPRLPDDALSENGRGLFLVWALAKRVQVVPDSRSGSTVRALLPVSVLAA
ncbi:MAG: ATP-binding protein [Candidatus Eremiobacteraeota bacterium]|nr:ATP-binding protein [Candidatus Eremiobacteraeota bacterium]